MVHGRAKIAAACAALVALLTAPATAAAPALRAPAAILLERDTGTIVYARAAEQPRAIASTTKLMTALVALERAPLGRRLTVAYYPAGPDESTAGLRAGQRVAVRDLLRAMLLPSANEAAFTLAVRLAPSLGAFVAAMNARARTLGLDETHYTTPVGLDMPGNYSSAADLARLTDVLLARYPFFDATVREPRALLPSAGDELVVNRNDLVGRYPFVVGVKTGHTAAAGYCLVGAASQSGVHLLSVVLGDADERARDADTLALLRYGLALYHQVEPIRGGHSYAHLAVVGRSDLRVALVARRSARFVLRRGAGLDVYLNGVPSEVRGPLPAGTPLGEIDARSRGRLVARVALVTAAPVPPPAAAAASRAVFGAAIALLGCSLPLMFVRRRGRGRGPLA